MQGAILKPDQETWPKISSCADKPAVSVKLISNCIKANSSGKPPNIV